MEQQNQILAVAGRKGSGKSALTREILPQARRLFMFDTMGEHRWIPDRFTDLNDAQIYLMESHTVSEFMGAFVPESKQEKDEFATICETVFEQGNMLFAVEEIPMLGMSAGYAPPDVARIARTGRHRNLDFLYTCQRLSEVWTGLRAQTDIFVLFSQTEPKDIDAIAERCGREIALAVEQLQRHDFIVYDVNQRVRLERVPALLAASPIVGEGD